MNVFKPDFKKKKFNNLNISTIGNIKNPLYNVIYISAHLLGELV